MKKHNLNWPQIAYHLYRMLITGGSWSVKTNLLFNTISHQPDIEQVYYMLKIYMEQNINF